MSQLLSVCFLMVLAIMRASCFNVDTKNPINFQGPPGSYFGFSVVLHAPRKMLYVGAPKANDRTILNRIVEPGGLFNCSTDGGSCNPIPVVEHNYQFTMNGVYQLRYKAWLGVALEIYSSGKLLACAHRYYTPRFESITGGCITLDPTATRTLPRILTPLDARRQQPDPTATRTLPRLLTPLENRQNLYTYNSAKREYRSYYANGQFGMSAALSEDEKAFVGAPGLYEGTGTDVIYSYLSSEIEVRKPLIIEPHSYFGYSITRGKFYHLKKEQSAVGAPRAENFGKVYIIDDKSKGGIDFHGEVLKGFELGEYFGASVLGVDLNEDFLTDLLVGAPLYATDMGCDEGKVYVYLSDGKEMVYSTELVGDRKTDARFGTALAKIGDLNQDGFQDVAVGAPYEDGKGAIYIYLGSAEGIKNKYSQKIEAVSINPDLSGFGIHISRGEDVDENGYPDIAVGSYLSSNVVLLRSLPVIDVYLDFVFDPESIKTNTADCLYENKNLPCVHIDVCLKYSGKNVSATLDFECSMIEDDPNPRGFFFPYRYKNAAVQWNLTARQFAESCFTSQFFLPSDVKDIVTPIPISLSCELKPLDLDSENGTVNGSYFSYPVVSPSSILNITYWLPFHSGCESEVCQSDLVVAAGLGELANGSVITLGEVTDVTLDVTVRNDGEPAFLSKLFITLPPDVSAISMNFCEGGSEKEKGITCQLGNPLSKGQMVGFQIKLDLTKISYQTRQITINLDSMTNSTEIFPENNRATLILGVKTVSDVGIRGIPSHSLILYHETEEMSSNIKHKYSVRNHGPSPLYSINVILQVPNAILSSQGRTEFLFFNGLQTDSQSEMTVSSVCNSSHMNTERFIPIIILAADDGNASFVYENDSFVSNFVNKRDVSSNPLESLRFQPDTGREKTSWSDEGKTHVLSCDSKDIECVTIQCSSFPLTDLRKFAEISVTFQIDFRALQNNFKSFSQIELISTASLFSPDDDIIILDDHPKISRVKTVLLDVRYSSRFVPQWLYFVGLSIGLMLMLQVVFVLIKVGFFKRKEKLALNRLRQSLSEVDLDEELLIIPSENDDDENSGEQEE